ncbi:MAG TPA: hypothetical protein VGD98_22170 [Ktedonobacteraceae bacterium]
MSNNVPDKTAQEQHFADIFTRLHEQDIEQFYAHYQLWVLRRRLPLIQIQIETLHAHLAENQRAIGIFQPSALALAVLVRLQSNGVSDTDVLDLMLDRGEDWLDRMMQRLDYCEQVEDFIQGDYTQWCIKSLEGAYDWIDSLLGSIKEDDGRSVDIFHEIVATEELLLQKLRLDGEEAIQEVTQKQAAVVHPADSDELELALVESGEPVQLQEGDELSASEESAENTLTPELVGWKDLEDLEAPEGQRVPWYSVETAEDGTSVTSSELVNPMNDWIKVLQAEATASTEADATAEAVANDLELLNSNEQVEMVEAESTLAILVENAQTDLSTEITAASLTPASAELAATESETESTPGETETAPVLPLAMIPEEEAVVLESGDYSLETMPAAPDISPESAMLPVEALDTTLSNAPDEASTADDQAQLPTGDVYETNSIDCGDDESASITGHSLVSIGKFELVEPEQVSEAPQTAQEESSLPDPTVLEEASISLSTTLALAHADQTGEIPYLADDASSALTSDTEEMRESAPLTVDSEEMADPDGSILQIADSEAISESALPAVDSEEMADPDGSILPIADSEAIGESALPAVDSEEMADPDGSILQIADSEAIGESALPAVDSEEMADPDGSSELEPGADASNEIIEDEVSISDPVLHKNPGVDLNAAQTSKTDLAGAEGVEHETDNNTAETGTESATAAIANDILSAENEQEEQLAWYEYLDLEESANASAHVASAQSDEPGASTHVGEQSDEHTSTEEFVENLVRKQTAPLPAMSETPAERGEIEGWQTWERRQADDETLPLDLKEMQPDHQFPLSDPQESFVEHKESSARQSEIAGPGVMRAGTGAVNAETPRAPVITPNQQQGKKPGFWRRLFGFGRKKQS